MRKLLLLMAASTTLYTCSLSPALAQTTEDIAKGNCKHTSDVCQKTLDYVNTKKGKLGKANVTNVLKDCITACDATEKFITRGSALQKKSAAMTIDACNQVAKSCDQFGDDKQMQACANEARKTVGNLQKITSM
ncbi:hypothetical protein KF707_18350 [Candidatus Obscuribacterales bacterium]|nr:hypothetical protein [Candidatus Obscuribacterales bacterium]MBX3138196.1 hypothetical protein [Candidatus Obscuribacterales bacterium]MBX3151217.1 hypothetical protein [Candidatus Obscuribacterales bacterium]